MDIDVERTKAERTKAQILDAAIAEFADGGLSGARVDRIAERAGVNKQLIYYYFGDKSGLFDAAVQAMALRFNRVRATLPDEPSERPAAYFRGAAGDVDVIRMLQWEGLQVGERSVVAEQERTAHLRRAVGSWRRDRASGAIDAEYDVRQLFLSMQALAAHPFAFPQMTRFITGRNPSDPAFQRSRVRHLRHLGRRLFG
ncbi:MAG: TetR/AcrR family transcriptional regulator [Dermatophilaceae bacterium]